MTTKVAIPIRHARERDVAPIVADGAIMSEGVADGKLLPLIILDTANRPDIDDVVLAHQNPSVQGDVKSSWVKQSWRDRSNLRLLLEFERPIACLAIVSFELKRFAGFVDQIVHNEGLYIQPGRPGDRLKNTLEAPRMIVEIDCDHFRNIWNPMFLREAEKALRRRGMRARRARADAPLLVEEWREFTLKQMSEYRD